MLWESTGTCRTPCARHILWRYASRSVPCCGPLRVPRLRVVCPRALPFAAALLPSFSPLPARAPAPTSTRFVVPSAASPGGPQRFAGAHCSLPQVAWTTTTRHTPSHSHRCSRANLATCATFSRKACARLLLQLVPRSHSSVFSARVLPFLPICTWHVDFPGPLSQAPINSPAVRSIRSVGGDTHNLIDGAIYTVGDAGPRTPRAVHSPTPCLVRLRWASPSCIACALFPPGDAQLPRRKRQSNRQQDPLWRPL